MGWRRRRHIGIELRLRSAVIHLAGSTSPAFVGNARDAHCLGADSLNTVCPNLLSAEQLTVSLDHSQSPSCTVLLRVVPSRSAAFRRRNGTAAVGGGSSTASGPLQLDSSPDVVEIFQAVTAVEVGLDFSQSSFDLAVTV